MALKEVCIAARDFGPGRAQEGDIILIREPRGAIGRKEGKDFLWLIMDEEDLPSAPEDIRKIKEDGSPNDRRARIDLDDLKAAHRNVDLARVRNPNDEYQPFVNPEPGTGRMRAQVRQRARFRLRKDK